jgi:hypothetical protein
MSRSETRIEFVHWQGDHHWLGYLVDDPNYLTQGETLEELRENLRDLYRDLTSGEIPRVGRVDELVVCAGTTDAGPLPVTARDLPPAARPASRRRSCRSDTPRRSPRGRRRGRGRGRRRRRPA